VDLLGSLGADRRPELIALRSIGERQLLVDRVAEERHSRLRSQHGDLQPGTTNLKAGRLLVCDPDFTVLDGAAEHTSAGFFDVRDLPQSFSWIGYVGEDQRADADPSADRDYWRAYLVALVPDGLIPLAERGIRANPVDCIAWAEDVDTTFTRWLRSERLL
jgi:hypothetical protein